MYSPSCFRTNSRHLYFHRKTLLNYFKFNFVLKLQRLSLVTLNSTLFRAWLKIKVSCFLPIAFFPQAKRGILHGLILLANPSELFNWYEVNFLIGMKCKDTATKLIAKIDLFLVITFQHFEIQRPIMILITLRSNH